MPREVEGEARELRVGELDLPLFEALKKVDLLDDVVGQQQNAPAAIIVRALIRPDVLRDEALVGRHEHGVFALAKVEDVGVIERMLGEATFDGGLPVARKVVFEARTEVLINYEGSGFATHLIERIARFWFAVENRWRKSS